MSDALDLDALAREFMVDREWADGADPDYAVICLRDLLARAVAAERVAVLNEAVVAIEYQRSLPRAMNPYYDDGIVAARLAISAIRARGAKPGEGA